MCNACPTFCLAAEPCQPDLKCLYSVVKCETQTLPGLGWNRSKMSRPDVSPPRARQNRIPDLKPYRDRWPTVAFYPRRVVHTIDLPGFGFHAPSVTLSTTRAIRRAASQRPCPSCPHEIEKHDSVHTRHTISLCSYTPRNGPGGVAEVHHVRERAHATRALKRSDPNGSAETVPLCRRHSMLTPLWLFPCTLL